MEYDTITCRRCALPMLAAGDPVTVCAFCGTATGRRLRGLIRRAAVPQVHFHRGPHGGPVPCFDSPCGVPPLAG